MSTKSIRATLQNPDGKKKKKKGKKGKRGKKEKSRVTETRKVAYRIDRRNALKHWNVEESASGKSALGVARYYKHPYVNLATIWLVVAITDIQPKIAWHNSEWNFYGAAFFELNVLSRLRSERSC